MKNTKRLIEQMMISTLVLSMALSCSHDPEVTQVPVVVVTPPVTTPVIIPIPITTPIGMKIAEYDYALKIQWDTIKSTNVKEYHIYRDTITNPTRLYLTTKNLCRYTDKYVLIHKKYYYRVTTVGIDGAETDKSLEVSGVPQEPINYGIPINGEVGAMCYAIWNFKNERSKEIIHQFTIYNEPTNSDGSKNNDGIYFQFNDSNINGIPAYFGIQTRMFNPKKGLVGKGVIFSRWETRDTLNYKTAPGGYGQSAGYEGNFIGVRKPYNWTPGHYEIKLRLDSSDSIGDWYGLYITKLSSNVNNVVADYIGSIRFERKSSTQGINNGGGTWIEVYSKASTSTPIPNWHVSIDKVLADGGESKSAYVFYAKDHFYGFSNMFTTNGKDVHFLLGSKVKLVNKDGYLW
jgi:hypothetical protein